MKWWVLHRIIPRYQYHIIRTTLKPGYYDPDRRIQSAFFDLTQEFLDRTENIIIWKSEEGHQKAYEAFKGASEFWKENRQRIQKDEYEGEGRIQEEAKKHMKAVIHYLEYMWYP